MREPTRQMTDACPIQKQVNIISRKIHDTFFLIDITDNYAQDKCALYEINETGNFIWDHINGQNSINDIATALQHAIVDEIDLQILVDDVRDFVEMLLAKEFVEV